MNPGFWTLELIYPAQATQYLAAMGRNRPPKPRRVERYANDIRNGLWRLTHQGIAFNCDGSLRDGQHRLMAIVEADMAVQMWVYRGLQTEDIRVIDTHGVRTDQNALWIDGLEVDNKDVATAKAMSFSIKSQTGYCAMGRDELHAYIVRHKEALEFVGEHLRSCDKGVRHSCVAAVVARAWYTVDRERLVEFCQVLCDGVTESRENFAAQRLRNWLQLSTGGSGTSSQRNIIYRKTESALRAFLERRDITKLYEVSREEFPLPEEVDADGH